MYLWHLFCQADCIAPLPLGGVLFPFPHPTGCRYCRFPRRSSCSPLADYVRPAKLAYRVPLCLTPTLLHAAIFTFVVECQLTPITKTFKAVIVIHAFVVQIPGLLSVNRCQRFAWRSTAWGKSEHSGPRTLFIKDPLHLHKQQYFILSIFRYS